MAANDFVYASVPLASDLTVKNTDSVDFAAGDVLKLDATNVLSGTQGAIGALRGTAAAVPLLGIAMEAIVQGKQGRVRPLGVAQAVASAAITAGVHVAAAASGQVAAQTAGQTQLGLALTAAANSGDKVLVLINVAKNA